jgi:ectoine hydroxylase-related dioxygenase (phytanoyl-CoA dioxygenase family)
MQVLDVPARQVCQADLDQFASEGYLRWGAMFEPAEVEALRAEYDRVFAEAEADGRYRNLSVGDGDEAAKRGHGTRMLQIINMCERSLAFRRLLYDRRLLAVVRELIGPNLMLFHDQALNKLPRVGGPVTWHQDNGYWRCRPANLVSCWIALDDADAENGAMQVSPGSHLAPQAHATSAQSGALLEVPPPENAVLVDLPAGGCMFHHCQTLHYTAPNRSARQRRAFIIHYMAVGTRDQKGEVLRASWERPILSLEM